MQRIIYYAYLVIVLSTPLLKADIVFNDGGTHSIDNIIKEIVYVKNTTTLRVLNGSELQAPLAILDNSIGVMTGGSVTHHVDVWENGYFSMSDGYISNLFSLDNSQSHIQGGVVSSLESSGTSKVYISNGSIAGYLVQYDSIAEISGGIVYDPWIYHNASVAIKGGTVDTLHNWFSGHLDMAGGEIKNGMYCWGESESFIHGGTLNSTRIEVTDNSLLSVDGGISIGNVGIVGADTATIIFDGYNFNLNGLPLSYGVYTSDFGTQPNRLKGNLSSGGYIECDLTLLESAMVIFIPEPCSILLLAIGGLLIGKRKF